MQLAISAKRIGWGRPTQREKSTFGSLRIFLLTTIDNFSVYLFETKSHVTPLLLLTSIYSAKQFSICLNNTFQKYKMFGGLVDKTAVQLSDWNKVFENVQASKKKNKKKKKRRKRWNSSEKYSSSLISHATEMFITVSQLGSSTISQSIRSVLVDMIERLRGLRSCCDHRRRYIENDCIWWSSLCSQCFPSRISLIASITAAASGLLL